MKTIGIVLAAGKSQRFGSDDKLLANYKGRTLCSFAADAMRSAGLDAQIACVSTPCVEQEFQGFDIVTCTGVQSDSLRFGLKRAMQLNADRVIIALADMPNITSSVLRKLKESDQPIAACIDESGLISVPALFESALFPELMKLEGDKGAKALLRANAALSTVEISRLESIDIDTPDQL
ncbi:MAG: nucleotidyltransferase family protein [Cognatishimia sp.]|uniref:nucleotidyltransferase family protein n=1 Tax=Cognatishimia sp. TaxID=2211648 RepID=UPI003B8C7590